MSTSAFEKYADSLETHEQRSCLRKQRYDTCPQVRPTMVAYPCQYCGGWHKAKKRD